MGQTSWRFIDWSKERKNWKRIFLILAVCCNLGILFYFKYFNFMINNINRVFDSQIAVRTIALPIGISFFTFQGMSYVIDLYLGKVEVQKKFVNVALYTSLFPQLIAGPIVRYIDVNEQIDHRTVGEAKFAEGIKRFILGLVKKVIISNQVAFIADIAFSQGAQERSVCMAWLGAICYTVQIYFGFGGYSDMAIGLGKMLGFDFLKIFVIHIFQRVLQSFGEGGIFRYQAGSGIMFTSL